MKKVAPTPYYTQQPGWNWSEQLIWKNPSVPGLVGVYSQTWPIILFTIEFNLTWQRTPYGHFNSKPLWISEWVSLWWSKNPSKNDVRWLILLMEEILHQLIWKISHYFQGLYMPGGCLGFMNHQQYLQVGKIKKQLQKLGSRSVSQKSRHFPLFLLVGHVPIIIP